MCPGGVMLQTWTSTVLVPLHLYSCVHTHTTHHNTQHNTHAHAHRHTHTHTHTHTHQRTHTHGAHTMVPQIPGDINFPVTTTGQEPHQSLQTVDTATDHTRTALQTLLQHCTSNTRAVVHKCMIYRQIHAHTHTHARTHARTPVGHGSSSCSPTLPYSRSNSCSSWAATGHANERLPIK